MKEFKLTPIDERRLLIRPALALFSQKFCLDTRQTLLVDRLRFAEWPSRFSSMMTCC
jgi:hypothetical protein